jgi:hypothetical protein
MVDDHRYPGLVLGTVTTPSKNFRFRFSLFVLAFECVVLICGPGAIPLLYKSETDSLCGSCPSLFLFVLLHINTHNMASFSHPEAVTAAIAEVLGSSATSGWYRSSPSHLSVLRLESIRDA